MSRDLASMSRDTSTPNLAFLLVEPAHLTPTLGKDWLHGR